MLCAFDHICIEKARYKFLIIIIIIIIILQSSPTWFQYVSDLQLKNVKEGHKLKLTYLYACWIMYQWGIICKHEYGTPKVARNAFNIGEVRNPLCYYGNKTVQLKLWSTFSRILLQRIKHFWCKLAEISSFIIFDQSLVEYMASPLG